MIEGGSNLADHTHRLQFAIHRRLGLERPLDLRLPAAVLVNGQNTVTNSISGAQQFYRLGQ
jgi:hypothetical protein